MTVLVGKKATDFSAPAVISVGEIVNALQFCEENGEVCPADWHKGDRAMKETREGVADYLSKR